MPINPLNFDTRWCILEKLDLDPFASENALFTVVHNSRRIFILMLTPSSYIFLSG